LTQVTYGTAVTSLTYDYAGRKTAMDDPDMGDWAYTYDALGNLTSQDDAKGQRTCLYYDPLNRLKGKTYTTISPACPADPGTYTASYFYDQGGATANAIGQRTGMSYGNTSSTWEYDPRGRLVEEHKTIGSTTYDTAWTYNTANLVETMTYPSEEGDRSKAGKTWVKWMWDS
jgi:YD repeat-containing protein